MCYLRCGVLAVILFSAASCAGVHEGPVVTSGPVQVISPLGEGTGYTTCGTAPNGFFSILVPSERLTTWHWREGLIQPGPSVVVDAPRVTRVAMDHIYAAERLYKEQIRSQIGLAFTSIATGKLLWTWSPPEHWEIMIGYGVIGVSTNGRYVGVALDRDLDNKFPGETALDHRLMVAVIDVSTMDVRYSPSLTILFRSQYVTRWRRLRRRPLCSSGALGGLIVFDIASSSTLFSGIVTAGGYFNCPTMWRFRLTARLSTPPTAQEVKHCV